MSIRDRQHNSKFFTAAFVVLAGFFALLSQARATVESSVVNAEISQSGDASHLVFKGLENWKYDVQKHGSEIRVRVPHLTRASVLKLKTYSDALIKNVAVNEQALDDSTELVFKLKSKEIDSFDYQTDQPTDLVVDFYVPDQAKKQSADDAPALDLSKSKKANTVAKKSALPEKGVEKADRQPAASEFIKTDDLPAASQEQSTDLEVVDKDLRHGIFDGGDPQFKRFSIEDYEIKESALIASRANIYLRFPMLKLESLHLKTILKSPPIYDIVATDTQENKEARLLLTLFKNKRPAIFLKTAKMFLKNYPDTKYDEIVRSMVADTYYDFWLAEKSPQDFETAVGLYRALSEKYPDSPLNTRTLLLIGYSYLDRGNNIDALKAFQRFVRMKPEAKAVDQVKISIAEAFLNLNRYDDALSILNEVTKGAANKKDAMEAAYRKGDVFFQKKDFTSAVSEYKNALQKYPEGGAEFPNAYYNKAEAEFWLNRYKESLASYRDFLQKFPDHDHGGYAMNRIGENLEIMGADSKKYLGAYLESGFRYRLTPGAKVARARLLSSRMPDMKEKELKNAVQEMENVIKDTQLADLEEFVTFLRTDGFYARHEYDRAAKELISYFQQHPNISNRQKFQTRIARSVTADIKSKVDKGDFIQALRTQSMYAGNWLKSADRIDTPYYTGKAYELAGVFKEAAKIYQQTLDRLIALKGADEKERSVFETLPKADAVRLRLAIVAAKQRDYAHAEQYLKAITSDTNLNEKEQVEHANVAVDVAEARGQNGEAKKYLEALVSTWKGQPAALSEIYLRLAKLQIQMKDQKGAESSLNSVLNLKTQSDAVTDDTHAKALELKADLDLSRGRREEALVSYRALLEKYDSTRPLSSIRYKVGKILFDDGDYKGAETAWSDLKKDQNGIWQKLAQEQLQSAKWQGDYKKYINRIPAMAPQ